MTAPGNPLKIPPGLGQVVMDEQDASLLIGALLAMMDGEARISDETLARLHRNTITVEYDQRCFQTIFRLVRRGEESDGDGEIRSNG